MDELAAENDRVFTFVGENGAALPPTGVLLKARVNAFRYVSPGKRYAVGVMTGNASMDVDIEFIETPSGRVLGKRRYATTSHTMEGIVITSYSIHYTKLYETSSTRALALTPTS